MSRGSSILTVVTLADQRADKEHAKRPGEETLVTQRTRCRKRGMLRRTGGGAGNSLSRVQFLESQEPLGIPDGDDATPPRGQSANGVRRSFSADDGKPIPPKARPGRGRGGRTPLSRAESGFTDVAGAPSPGSVLVDLSVDRCNQAGAS